MEAPAPAPHTKTTSSRWYSRFLYHRRGQDANHTTLMVGGPLLLKYRSSTWFAVLTVSLAAFTDVFLYGVLVPVLPFALTHKAHIQQSSVQSWVSTLLAIYGAGTVAFAPICGWLSDRISSRRWPLLTGLIALIGTTVMTHIGGSIAIFVVARLLQGISAAVVWVAGFALLADTVAQNQLGQYMGYLSLSMSLGYLIGPVLGGVVYQRAGYNAVFTMCYALIVLDLLCRILLIEKKDIERRRDVSDSSNVIPMATMAASEDNCGLEPRIEKSGQPVDLEETGDARALAPMTIPTSTSPGAKTTIAPMKGGDQQQKSSESEPPATLNSPSTAKTIRPFQRRRRTSSKLPPIITLLSSRRLLAALFACLALSIIMAAFDTVLPIYENQIFNWYSLQAGVLQLAIAVPSFVSPAVGHFCDRYGCRWFATAGFLVGCPVYILLRLVDHDSLSQKFALCTMLGFLGLCIALSFPPLTAEVSYIVTANERARPGIYGPGGAHGQAYSLFNVAFAAGSMIGPLWGGFVKNAAGWGTMTWSLGLLSGVTALPTVCFVGGTIWKKRERKRERDHVQWRVDTEPRKRE